MKPQPKFLRHPILMFLFLLGANSAFSQIDHGSIKNFAIYTSNGAVANTSTSQFTGDIGAEIGDISGFAAPSIVNGSVQNANAITAQASLDLDAMVYQINMASTTATHAPVFGSETLTPGVYSQAGSASLVGTLTLDAQGDPDAEFIFKIGGAFSTAVGAKVILINCATPENVFWLSGDDISVGHTSSISGNLISNPGDITINTGGSLDGRMLSTTGAISVYASAINTRLSGIDAITQPTCTIATGSFQIRNYDAAATYTFSPTVISMSATGLVTANPDSYTMTAETSVSGCVSMSSHTVVIDPTPINYWTGAISSDWHDGQNWTCGVPSLANDLINSIPVVTTSYPIIASDPDAGGLVKNLEIQALASLVIHNNYLRVTTNLKLDGTIYLKEESQLLQDAGSVLDAASIGTIEIDQQGTGSSFRYNYWSSPVNSAGNTFTIGDVLRDGTDPDNNQNIDFGATVSYADGAPSSPIKLSTYWMYKLEDSGSGYSAWSRVRHTGTVNVGQGYSMKGSNTSEEEQNYTFVGKPNNGFIELRVNGNNDYLIGNPYPSAIDANKFIQDNGVFPGSASITGTLYFWDHYSGDTHNTADYPAGYATYTKGGGVAAAASRGLGDPDPSASVPKGAPQQFIPVGQGFFVVGDADGGQIQFNNSQREFQKEYAENSIFMRPNTSVSNIADNQQGDVRPKFRIGFDAPKISHRQILLTLDDTTTDAVDWGFDAEMYEVFEDDMYWSLNDKKYVIQAMHTFGLEKEIPLGIRTMEGGLISIKIDELEHTEDYASIYIKDSYTGELHDITNQAFEINLEAGEYQDRFLLVFQSTTLTAEELAFNDGLQIYMNNSLSELQLNRIDTTEIRNVSVYNNFGQQVKTWNINQQESTMSLPLNVAAGIYIVNVDTTSGNINKKIIIY